MRVMIADTYYPDFMASVYRARPEAVDMEYREQLRTLLDQCFGTADFYSANLAPLGHEACEVVINCRPLQEQWAREHRVAVRRSKWRVRLRRGIVPWLDRVDVDDWPYQVFVEQVRAYGPDVLYIQNINAMPAWVLKAVRDCVRHIVGQIACPMRPGLDLSQYDLVLTSFPHFVTRFRQQGVASQYFRLGFESSVLQKVGPVDPDVDVSFVGGVSPAHGKRLALLESLVDHGLQVWGYGIEGVRKQSLLHRCYRSQAWGLEMYGVLGRSRIALNNHIDIAEGFANNMRLYEATGMGALLVTDHKENLTDIFVPGKEVVVYQSVEECREVISHYLDHPQEAKRIAKAGQQRTLSEHTYSHRMEELADILKALD